LLWIAPELLPLTVTPGRPATQKGDVYSFGIILEEIVVRGGPYEAARQFLDPQGIRIDRSISGINIFSFLEIITRVRVRESPPFRPIVEQRDCPESLSELMERCWSDNPEERPTFDTLKGTIRFIMK
jgi:atrial natriuretic peptide receptor A